MKALTLAIPVVLCCALVCVAAYRDKSWAVAVMAVASGASLVAAGLVR